MKAPRNLSRRKFIKIAATTAATAPVVSCTVNTSPWRFFTLTQAQTLEAICERIIPTDQYPGAAQVGVVNYIDRQLMGHFRRFQKAYRDGIAGVDQTSLALFNSRFVDLPTEKQDEVLAILEKGEAPGEVWKQRSPKRVFNMVVNHTMQGFYGDPRHGGNRHAASWRMLGVPYPPIRGRLQYDLTKAESKKPA